MANEHGEWIMHGVEEDDPRCIKTTDALIAYIDEIGFLPLFQNDIPGFSVEERTVARYWWSDDAARDPWRWREQIAASGKVAYGKFFDKKACFVSLQWLPDFINYRRDGYDFDARWDDGKANYRSKRIMDLFLDGRARFSFEAKQLAGFGKGGEKNFEGVITDLQMQTYLVVRDFKQRQNKAGTAYGWPIAVYATPESIWGYDFAASAYEKDPQVSKARMTAHLSAVLPQATERQILKFLK